MITMEINDTYLVVDIETKEVFGHYDTPGKANGQVKRKGARYAVYVVSEVYPLMPPKKIIRDFTNNKYCETLEDCQESMKDAMVEQEVEDAGYACRGDDELTDYFVFQGKCYKITVSIEWNRYDKQYYYVECSDVVSCEECDKPE